MSNKKLLSSQVVEDELIIGLCPRIDMENAARVEEELFGLVDHNPGREITLDAGNLDYISSAGLRILINAKKRLPSLKMVNVNSEVYGILETTGINSIIPVSKRLRELSVEGLEVIGAGFNGRVYKLDDEIIVKVIENRNMTYEMIQDERDRARKVFLTGIPSAIAFDVVRVGDNYGIIYELVNSDSLVNLIRENQDQLFEMGKQFGEFMRQVHAIKIESPSDLADSKLALLNRIETIKDKLTDEEYTLYRELFNSIPEGDSFIHGDFHPDNVLMQNGEMVLIDMGDSGVGHPIIDLISLCVVYKGTHLIFPDAPVMKTTQLTIEQDNEVWRGFLHGYFGTDDQEYLDEIESQLLPRIYLRNLTDVILRAPDMDSITDPEERQREEELNKFRLQVIDLMKDAIATTARDMKGTVPF